MSYQPSVAINGKWVLASLLLVWALANGAPAVAVFAESALDPWNWRLDEIEPIFRNSRTWGGYWALAAGAATGILFIPIICVVCLRRREGERLALRKWAFNLLALWFACYCVLYFSMGLSGQMLSMDDPLCVGVETPGPDNCDVNGVNFFMVALPTINLIVSASLLISTWFVFNRESET